MKKRGSVYIIVLLTSAVIYIIAMGFIFMTTTSRKQEMMDKNRLIAKYLAEAGIERGLNSISNIFYSELLQGEAKKLNKEKLYILDYEKAKEFAKVISIDDMVEGGRTDVVISIEKITNNRSLGSSLKVIPGEEDKIPDDLSAYKLQKSGASDKKLGGYVGTLKITSKGIFNKREYTVTATKSLKVINVSPIGEEYTLFIQGENEEHLRFGKFLLSNWTVDMKEVNGLVTKIKELASKKKTQVPDTSINDFASSLNFVKQFVMINKDSDIKKEASNLLFNLDFRKWGRVRTNGQLHVYLPFFEVDDIINYFVENKYYSKPEVGYVGCFNRLHNNYLGKYTRYEGNIRKHYYRLAPYVLSRRFPVERNDKYTRFSTDSYYPAEHPNEKEPENLIITRTGDIEKFLHQETAKDLILRGTRLNPIPVNGLTAIDGNLTISGYVKGKGALIVKGNIVLDGNIQYFDDSSLLSLVSVNNPIFIKNTVENVELDGCVYSKNSIKGGKKIKINGNLVVFNLNRQQGAEARDTIMPREVEVVYNKKLRNYYARHIYGGVSLKPVNMYMDELTESDIDTYSYKEKNMFK